ncbi:dienelactone hydrolase-like enzyme [Syncephalis pseudoplumigaleata]|uniref:Dienelactone hydrolase-like enzyme n=1 Tax=Syncephalis pseudoplumigaleata TaxID=1712513 RepID=A0A4P9YS71_9FUNG|nr:dienelactone hydrolase-like enzyme [Syncephalis pseudoplumigaleata]|eukprot:RKP22604.1 dienelactone hydrolase-like enzyme [Syncephalis pseudoplumigaleata]
MMLNDTIQIPVAGAAAPLEGQLQLPSDEAGLCLFVHGSGSSRFSPRFVADHLNRRGFGSLLLDLMTPDEEAQAEITRALRFGIPFLAKRVVEVIDHLQMYDPTRQRSLVLFGASTGSAAAIIAASERSQLVRCVVSRGGRPDLVPPAILHAVQQPSLFIVGGNDTEVLKMNRSALDMLGAREKHLEIVPHATHLFEEAGALEQVASLTSNWCLQHHMDHRQ